MPWRPPSERRAAQKRARCSAENAILRLLGTKRAPAVQTEVERREQIARPALTALVGGIEAPSDTRLQRNVALHSDDLPPPGAGMSAYRQAQRGPRLEDRQHRPASEHVVSSPYLSAQPQTVTQLVPVFFPVVKVKYVVVEVPAIQHCAKGVPPRESSRGPDMNTFLAMAALVRLHVPHLPEIRVPPMLSDRCCPWPYSLGVRWAPHYELLVRAIFSRLRPPHLCEGCGPLALTGPAGGATGDVSVSAFPDLFFWKRPRHATEAVATNLFPKIKQQTHSDR